MVFDTVGCIMSNNKHIINRFFQKRSIRRTIMEGFLSRFTPVNPNPVLILGNQKTGTSAIAKLLALATGLSVTIDLPRMIRDARPNMHVTELSLPNLIAQNKREFSRDIVKEPALTFIYKQLVQGFPQSPIIFVTRDPRDNIRSILDRVSLPGNASQLCESDLQSVEAAWRFYTLDGHWLGHAELPYIDRLAARWNLAADIYLQHPDSMVLVRYEDFVSDKAGTIARLAESIGKPVVSDITAQVNVQYQRQGRNRGANWHDFFGTENLARIEDLCDSRMRSFGYQRSTEMSHAN
jgi:hypothetical protein